MARKTFPRSRSATSARVRSAPRAPAQDASSERRRTISARSCSGLTRASELGDEALNGGDAGLALAIDLAEEPVDRTGAEGSRLKHPGASFHGKVGEVGH